MNAEAPLNNLWSSINVNTVRRAARIVCTLKVIVSTTNSMNRARDTREKSEQTYNTDNDARTCEVNDSQANFFS